MWLDEYNRLMFKPVNNHQETIQAVKLKHQHMPEVVYKYRTVKPYTIDALEKGFLMAASPSSLNDPNEGRMFIDFKNRWKLIYHKFQQMFYEKTGHKLAVELNTFEERDELIIRMLEYFSAPKEHYAMWIELWKFIDENMQEKIIDFQNELIKINDEVHRICSFSEIRDSTLMWAHYADQSKGFCIGYNLKELNNDLTELLMPVRYTDSLIEVDETFFNGEETNQSFLMNSLTLKSSEWHYEKEWRLLLLALNTEKMQKVQMPVPKEIVLGLNITSENQSRLIEIANIKQVPCYQMFKESNSFQFRFEKIN
jgi:hypothetical protein